MTPQAIERFWNRVRIGDGCWPWTASKFPNGYGQTSLGAYKERYAHRVSWMIENGPIPPKMLIMHKCDNPVCVRPDHLMAGSCRDNSVDMFNKGRGNRAIGERQWLSKLKEYQVLEICARLIAGEKCQPIASSYGVTSGTIAAIQRGVSWSYLTKNMMIPYTRQRRWHRPTTPDSAPSPAEGDASL